MSDDEEAGEEGAGEVGDEGVEEGEADEALSVEPLP